MSRHFILARNAVVNLGGRVAAIVLALVVSTVLFRQLGAADYGAWSLLVAVAGYSVLFDFGLSAAVERSVAVHWVTRDEAGLSRVLSTALTVLALGLGALQILIAAWFQWQRPWHWPEGILDRGLLVLPVGMAMTASALVVGAGLSGLQRMAALHLWRVVGLALGSIAVLGASALGVRRMDVLLIAYCAGGGVTAVLQWKTLRTLVPGLVLRTGLERGAASDLVRFGGVLQVATMVPPIAEYAFRVLIGARFGLELVGVYDLAGRAAIVLRSLAGALFTAMVPFGVQTFVERGAKGVEELLTLTAKYAALLVLPATALLWSQADSLVSLWLGDGQAAEQVSLGFRILIVAHAGASLSVPIAMLGRSAGKPALEAAVTAASFLMGLTASGWAMSWPVSFGFIWGVPALGGFALWMLLGKAIGVRFRSGRDLAMAGVLSAISFGAAELGEHLVWRLGSSSAMVAVVVAAVASSAAVLIAVVLLGVVDSAEWRSLRRIAESPSRMVDGAN